MTRITQRLRRLATMPLPARVAVLGEALARAHGDEAPRLVIALLQIRTPAATAVAIRLMHRAGPDAALLIVRHASELAPAIRQVLRSGHGQAARNVIELIRRWGHPAMAHELVDLLDSKAGDVVGAAARALRELSDWRRWVGAGWPAVELERPTLDHALARAVNQYRRHRRREALWAAVASVGRLGPAMRAVLDDAEHPANMTVRGVLARDDSPLVRQSLLRWVGEASLSPAALRGWSTALAQASGSDALVEGWLIRAPRRRRALRAIAHPRTCLPSPIQAGQLADRAQAWLPDLVQALDLATTDRIAALRSWRAAPSPLARTRIVQALIRLDSAAAAQAMLEFESDPDDRLAVLAAWCGATRGADAGADRRALRPGRAFGGVAAFDNLVAARRSLDWFVSHLPELGTRERLAAGLRWRAVSPQELSARLQAVLISGRREPVLAAISVAQRLRLVAALEEPIIRLLANGDAWVAASAASALAAAGRSVSNRTGAALRIALRHHDARVRANAVESLSRLRHPPPAFLVEPFCLSGDSRLRANAIGGLCRAAPADGQRRLRQMLGDDDSRHRLSAVWVSGRLRDRELLALVRRMAQADDNAAVRRRAEGAARLMLARRAMGQAVQEAAR